MLMLYTPECVLISHGVIGNTSVFGADVQGSSPCGKTKLR